MIRGYFIIRTSKSKSNPCVRRQSHELQIRYKRVHITTAVYRKFDEFIIFILFSLYNYIGIINDLLINSFPYAYIIIYCFIKGGRNLFVIRK